MVALKRVFRYLKGTKNRHLHFWGALGGRPGGEGENTLRHYVDSDYAGCPDEEALTGGLFITCGGAIEWRSRKLMSTAQSTADGKYYTFRPSCIGLTRISHHLNELGIPTIPHVFSNSQSLIASIENRIYHRTAVALIANKYYLAVDMPTDGEVKSSYVPTGEMLVDCCTNSRPKPANLKQFAAMGMIGIGLGNGLRINLTNRHKNDITIGLGNGHANHIGIGSGNVIENGVGRYISSAHLFPGDPQCLIGSSSHLFTIFVLNGGDSRPGGVLRWLDVRKSLCKELWCDMPLL